MSFSQPDSPITSRGTPGQRSLSPHQTILLGSVYETLVNISCYVFRDHKQLNSDFPYGGTALDPSPVYSSHPLMASSFSLPRLDTIIEIFKILYVFKSQQDTDNATSRTLLVTRDTLPQPSSHAHLLSLPYLPISLIDYSLHVLLIEILLYPSSLCPDKLFYDLQIHSIQLFSVMIPETETVALILHLIYNKNEK
jgi:hypothetical protein